MNNLRCDGFEPINSASQKDNIYCKNNNSEFIELRYSFIFNYIYVVIYRYILIVAV